MLCHGSSAFSMAHLWAASSCNSASEHFAKVVKRVFWQRSTSLTALRLKIVESTFSRLPIAQFCNPLSHAVGAERSACLTKAPPPNSWCSFFTEVLKRKFWLRSSTALNQHDVIIRMACLCLQKECVSFSIFITASKGYNDLAFLPKFTLQSAHTKRSSQLSTTNVPLNYREMVQSFCPFYLCWWRSENGKRGWSSELCVTDFNEYSKYGITANWSPNIIVSWLNWHLSLKMKSGLHYQDAASLHWLYWILKRWWSLKIGRASHWLKWQVTANEKWAPNPYCAPTNMLLQLCPARPDQLSPCWHFGRAL